MRQDNKRGVNKENLLQGLTPTHIGHLDSGQSPHLVVKRGEASKGRILAVTIQLYQNIMLSTNLMYAAICTT